MGDKTQTHTDRTLEDFLCAFSHTLLAGRVGGLCDACLPLLSTSSLSSLSLLSSLPSSLPLSVCVTFYVCISPTPHLYIAHAWEAAHLHCVRTGMEIRQASQTGSWCCACARAQLTAAPAAFHLPPLPASLISFPCPHCPLLLQSMHVFFCAHHTPFSTAMCT